MARRKLDNIDRDVIAMTQLGYGSRYGDYKADHPHTRQMEPAEPKIPVEHLRMCRNCGKAFSTKGRHYRKLYCDDRCRMQYNSNMAYLKRKKKEADSNGLEV